MEISTDEILARRLCLVCARDGVEKPVQEHEVDDPHFIVTIRALRDYMSRKGVLFQHNETKIGRALLWDMACEVGGFRKSFGQRHLDWVPLYRCEEQDHWYDTEREAVLRAGMDQAWESVGKGVE